MKPIIQFEPKHIQDMKTYFMFTCAMISTCDPLFPDQWDNHDVEKALEKAKVIRSQCDSESSQLFVYFKSRKAGEAFITRLNAYLVQRAKEMERLGLL